MLDDQDTVSTSSTSNTSSTATPQVGLPPTAVPATWEDLVQHEARKQKVSPKLALTIMQTESGGKAGAKSPAGAIGLMQLMPETAKRLGVDPNDPVQNIRGGVAELRRLIDENDGDVEAVLRGYNGSPTASKEATDPYVRTVLGRLGGSPSPTAQKANGPKAVGSPSVSTTAAKIATPPPAAPPASTNLGDVFQRAPLEAGWNMAKSIGSAFNPMESAGRKNLAGAAGAIAAGSLTGGVGLAPALYGALGAGIGGGLATSAEQAITGKGEAGEDLLEAGKQAGLNLLGSGTGWILQGAGRLAIRGAVSRNAARSLSAESQAVHEGLDAGSAAYRSLLEKPASARAAGKAAAAVREGPAKAVREEVGQAVEDAAAGGPALKLEGTRAKAQEIFDKQIKDAENYFSGKASAEAEGEPALAGVSGNATDLLRGLLKHGVSEDQRAAITSQLVGAGMPQDVAEATIEGARHPAAGVLRRIVNAPEDVPFAAAHQLKRQLGEAVDWEHPAKKQVQQITKGVFQSLRSDMAGHEPYNQATARYAEIMPLFNKGFGKQILKDAVEEPGRFVGRISPAKPEQTKMLRELLVDLPAEQGGPSAAAGLKAWNGIRSAWTYDKVIKGGVEKMGDRLEKLTPDFVQEFYGDREGAAILANLKQMHTAWKVSADQATDTQARFLGSSLAPKKAQQPDAVLMDVLRATALGAHSAWGALSAARLILGGAGAADLVEWASRSPQSTQLMVTAFTSPAPGRAVANLYRMLTGNEAPSPVGPPPGGRFAGDGLSKDGSETASPLGQPPPR